MFASRAADLRLGALALGWLLLGCEQTAELGAYAGAGEETGDNAGSGAKLPDLGSTDAETGDAGGTDGALEADDGGDGDGDGVCDIDGSESPCRICLEHLCCAQLESCDGESGCFCMLDCLTEGDAVTCATTCTPGLAYFQLLQCQATSCAAVCE